MTNFTVTLTITLTVILTVTLTVTLTVDVPLVVDGARARCQLPRRRAVIKGSRVLVRAEPLDVAALQRIEEGVGTDTCVAGGSGAGTGGSTHGAGGASRASK